MANLEFHRGEVLYDQNFYYPDAKKQSPKLLLVLNKDHTVLEDVVVVPATTSESVARLRHGCNESFKRFYFEKKIGFYDPPTVLQFEFIQSIDFEVLEGRVKRDEIRRTGKADQEEFGQIINCLKKMKDDIRLDVQKLIF